MIRSLVAVLVGVAVLAPTAPAAAAPEGCTVSASTLTWGFKESFRAYIDGSIANGSWTVADGATYATPSFGFAASSGDLDPRDGTGSVAYPGSIEFTGHGGLLDTVVANPTLTLQGDGAAVLLLDVRGVSMEGDDIAVSQTPFVSLDLAGQDLTPVGGIITLTEVPTVLTAEGNAAFPDYETGTAFDPISATFDVGDCALVPRPIESRVPVDDSALNLSPVWLFVLIPVVLIPALWIAAFRWRRGR